LQLAARRGGNKFPLEIMGGFVLLGMEAVSNHARMAKNGRLEPGGEVQLERNGGIGPGFL